MDSLKHSILLCLIGHCLDILTMAPVRSAEANSSEEKTCVKADKKATQKKPYKCRFCSNTFHYKAVFKEHERMHTGEKPFTCDYCLKSFSRATNLTVHKRIHTGEKPFKCDQCSKCFIKSSGLIIHKRVHSGETPFGCRFCERFFRHTSSRNSHEQRSHRGEKPSQWDKCPKSTTSYRLLIDKKCRKTSRNIQERTHLKKRPCQRPDLKIHETIHFGEKPFKCDKCDRSYSALSRLKVHQKSHKGKRSKPQCPLCHKPFKSSSGLTNHMKVHSENSKKKSSSKVPRRKGSYKCGTNVQSVDSYVKTECSENSSSVPDTLSEILTWIKQEVGNDAEHELCSKLVGQDSGIASVIIKVEGSDTAEEQSSKPFEFVCRNSSEHLSDGKDEPVERCHDSLDVKIKRRN